MPNNGAHLGFQETKFKQTEIGMFPVDWEAKRLGVI